ncbi:beta-lactamase class C [Nitrobacteraceae bacterium AZCC 2161]
MSDPAVNTTPSPQEIVQAEAQIYLDFSHAPGCCIAVYDQKAFGSKGYAYPLGMSGPPNASSPPFSVTTDTVFEIGSVTKVFTSTLLATAVKAGGPSLTDTLSYWLNYHNTFSQKPVGSAALDALTLLELATHSSGMTEQPTGIGLGYSKQLFADELPAPDLINWWNNYPPPPPPPTYPPGCWQYSNIGFVTLGFAVTQMFPTDTGYNYDTMLAQYVTTPLGMTQTGAVVQPSWKVAQGCIGSWIQFPNPPGLIVFENNTPTDGTAFDLKTTGDDMLRFLAAQIEAPNGVIGPVIALTHQKQGTYPLCEGTGSVTMGLAWQIYYTKQGYPIYMKNGATSRGGFEAIVIVVPKLQCGVAVLSNQFLDASAPHPSQADLGGIARNIIAHLHSDFELDGPLPERDISD